MARYRFHCTNGVECVLDTKGSDIRAFGRLRSRAEQVALDVIRAMEDRTDWSDWRVTVHDLEGRRILLHPFESLAECRSALAA